ncbi:phosphoribosylglycinamide formyltransferase [Paenibacillus sp. N1-5-1-14]|uniref:phosphoribosylglycinamide formyltransferase n=1 Tax=Paenibacillus radicibacter TaxID=2972488 RepID=UPI002159765D|nr:phosphoribosylglycinamide formyltransferase [Paenibacillus radicibacter]MCR8644544.1 phosphoribosylglycinamide formyltransferase [Paenibacillus radicibacter]
MSEYRIAVFASGSGSNFTAIEDAIKQGKLEVSLSLLVSDRPNAPVVDKAKQAGVPVFVFQPKDYASREAYEEEIVHQLHEHQIDLIVLAGYMRLITSKLVEPFYGKIINVHPSLLPAFPGMNAVKQALDYGVKLTGVTVHLVDGGLDSGPVIAQQVVEINDGDTEEMVLHRVHEAEHQLYPKVINWFSKGQVRLEGRHVHLNTTHPS